MANLDLDKSSKYIILDTDMGVDDAWSMFLLLRVILQLNKVKLFAVTCVPGNTSQNYTVRNAYRVLNAFNRTDVSLSYDQFFKHIMMN